MVGTGVQQISFETQNPYFTTDLFSANYDQGETWKHFAVTVSYGRDLKFSIEGITQGSETADLAVAHLNIKPGACNSEPGKLSYLTNFPSLVWRYWKHVV